MGVVEHRRDRLSPDQPIQSLESFVTLFEGDFYNALETYREMRAAAGVGFPESAEAAYEPVWDTWGFREDFSPESVLATVPHLKDMGIRWITLDDRWYDATGDWRPREDRFPGGDEEFAGFVERLHREGMKVRLWTLPAEVDGAVDTAAWLKAHPSALTEVRKHSHHRHARFHEEHPDWVVVDPAGDAELSKRGNCFCCGSVPGVREHFRQIARRMFGEWKVDGLKQDAVYVCSACYSAEHGHRSPDEASRDYAEILRAIYETALEHNPAAVIVNCPCGTTLTPDWMRWQNQALSPDPWTSWVNRGTVKQLKALFGPRSAVLLDHVELSDEGQDFSLIGVGGVPATRITPTGEEKTFGAAAELTFEERKAIWTRWIGLYRELMLSRGEYLNLYDLVYDVPETHVIRQGATLYYAFYPGEPDGIVADNRELYSRRRHSKQFKGCLELRGLDPAKSYRVYDYENEIDLGRRHRRRALPRGRDRPPPPGGGLQDRLTAGPGRWAVPGRGSFRCNWRVLGHEGHGRGPHVVTGPLRPCARLAPMAGQGDQPGKARARDGGTRHQCAQWVVWRLPRRNRQWASAAHGVLRRQPTGGAGGLRGATVGEGLCSGARARLQRVAVGFSRAPRGRRLRKAVGAALRLHATVPALQYRIARLHQR